MTRRGFIEKFIKVGAGVVAGVWCAAKVTGRKFVRAVKLEKYPGPLKPLKDIWKQGKWRG